MYILDTNVISELRKAKKAHQNVRKWAQPLPAASLYISVISILELEIGILLVERRDKEQGAILRTWMDRHVLPTFSGRILAIDTAVASAVQCFTCLTLALIVRPLSQLQPSCTV
jgi:toxin FitB